MQRRLSSNLLLALALALGSEVAAYGQVYRGTIAGRVSDQTGAVLPGVTVTVTSDVMIQPQTAVTSETGAYRFAELPVGTYTVTFELSGFQRVVRENIILTAGSTQTINMVLALAEIQETVTVSSESPVVDVRQTGIPETFDRERLEEMPTARDPWVIVEQTPGVVMDRQNVGGNESGQQSNWSTRGTDVSQNTWTYDGVNITDMAASGASPMYYDFGAFQEINVTTGGQDASMQSAGTALNFIVKQGTNRWKGQASFYGTNDSLQSDNITDALRAEGAGAGAPIKKILDYGFDVGGPILKDRAWIWGDYGVQDIHTGTVGFLVPGCNDPSDPSCLEDDPTNLKNFNIKFNLQASKYNKFNFLVAHNNKHKATRGASTTRPFETTWDQSGPTTIYKFEDTHIFSDNFLLTGRFAYVDGGFRFDYQSSDLRDTQVNYELTTGAYSGSLSDYNTTRPQYTGNLDGNYFLSNALGGDHELKFGFQYKKSPVDSFSTYGGDVVAVFDGGQSAEAWFIRPTATSYEGEYTSFYGQDVYTRDRVALKASLRFDHQVGKNLATDIPANRVIPDLMPGLSYQGSDSIKAWNRFSPRVGLTYDFTGDGRTIARVNYARYYDILNLAPQVTLTNPTGYTEWDVPWMDLNGDGLVQGNEVDPTQTLYTSNFDPANPTALTSPNVRDPNTTPPATDEVIAGFERELMPDLSVGANYVYKRFTNMIWYEWPYSGSTGRSGLTGQPYPSPGVPASAFVAVTSDIGGRTVMYYELAPGFQRAGDYLTNRPDYHQRFNGIELTANKRMSHRWMMNAGFTYGDTKEFFEGPGGIYDPTNVDLRDGGSVAPYSAGSSKTRLFLNSKWVFRLDALVEFPYEIRVGGKLNGRQGFPMIETLRTDNRSGGLGRVEVLLNPVGDTRLDNLWVADLRLEKSFDLGRARVSGIMDIFNLVNSATVLKREQRQNFTTANDIQEILSPRVFRFGARVTF